MASSSAPKIATEPKPSPPRALQPRGEMNLDVGRTTADRMKRSLFGFEERSSQSLGIAPPQLYQNAEVAGLCTARLRTLLVFFRPLLVYAITAVQDGRPQFKHQLTAAWQIDRKWQIAEPGECKPVISLPIIRAATAVALLWQWFRFTGLVLLGFAGMLRPGELLHLTKRDLALPSAL